MQQRLQKTHWTSLGSTTSEQPGKSAVHRKVTHNTSKQRLHVRSVVFNITVQTHMKESHAVTRSMEMPTFVDSATPFLSHRPCHLCAFHDLHLREFLLWKRGLSCPLISSAFPDLAPYVAVPFLVAPWLGFPFAFSAVPPPSHSTSFQCFSIHLRTRT